MARNYQDSDISCPSPLITPEFIRSMDNLRPVQPPPTWMPQVLRLHHRHPPPLRDQRPYHTAKGFAFSQLQRGTSLGLSNFSVEIKVLVRNHDAAAFRNKNMTISLYYKAEVAGKGGVPPGKVGTRGRKQLNVSVTVDGGKVAGAEGFVGNWRRWILSFWSETRAAGKGKITDVIKKKLAVRLDRHSSFVVDTGDPELRDHLI